MYIWKVDKLVSDFKSGNVSQKEELKYFMLLSALTSLIVEPLYSISKVHNLYDTLNSLSLLLVILLGTYYCYKINSKGDDKDFIVRVYCIGLPVMVRMFVFIIPITILVVVLKEIFFASHLTPASNPEQYETSLDTVLLSLFFVIIYYVYLARKIRAVST